MKNFLEWIRKAQYNHDQTNAKIVARAGERYGDDKVSMAENLIRGAVLGAFAAAPPEVRVHTMTVLRALYCPRCGREQPDTPTDECTCGKLN